MIFSQIRCFYTSFYSKLDLDSNFKKQHDKSQITNLSVKIKCRNEAAPWSKEFTYVEMKFILFNRRCLKC